MKEKEKDIQGSIDVVSESELDKTLDNKIKELLITSFGWTLEFQERSYWHLKPAIRFVFKDNSGRVLGHTSIVEKKAVIEGEEIKIAGVGAYAVHPEFRNSGIGKKLAQEVIKHTIKQGYDLIVGFAKDPVSRHICIQSGAVPTRDIFIVTYPDGGEVLKPYTLVWPIVEEKYQRLLHSGQPIILGYGSW